MDTLWFSPLTPAILLLVGAVLVAILPGKSYLSLATSLLVLAVLISRIVFRLTVSALASPIVFSDWGLGEELTMRVDGLSLAFLFIPVFLLIGLFWARQANDPGISLGVAGAVAPVFVAANGISFSYALLFFDVIGCMYWLRLQRPNLAVTRLFLAIFTIGVLMLAGLGETTRFGSPLLAFALWLRVGLFPFVEISYITPARLRDGESMVWFALSTAVGVYVAARFLTVPLPQTVMVLMVLIMLLSAWLAWLDDLKRIRLKLLRMMLTQPSLALLIAPISARVSITLGLVYTLGLGTLWLTPQIGRPNLLERHWVWIYAAPIMATLSLIGFPATLGWLAAVHIYTDLLLTGQQGLVAAVLLAQGIACSVLYQYWVWLWQGQDEKGPPLRAAIILTIPFLVPGVGGVMFSLVTGLDLSPSNNNMPLIISTAIILLIISFLALVFGYGRLIILRWLKITPQVTASVLDLTWLWPGMWQGANQIGQGVLRLKSILEGAHYLGWAFLIGLVGILVVILR